MRHYYPRMAPTSRVAVSLDLSPGAPIEVVSAVIGHITAVCQLDGQLQDRVSRVLALRAVLREPGPWLRDDVDFDGSYFWRPGYSEPFLLGGERYVSPSLERAIARSMHENDLDSDGDVYVERLMYENPVEVVVAVGAVVLAVLRLVRDWPDRRRTNRARADDYEDQVAMRKQVRRIFVDGIASGQHPVRPEDINELLTKHTVDAFRALGDGRVDVREIDKPTED